MENTNRLVIKPISKERLSGMKRNYRYYPKTKDELIQTIKAKIANEGNECDLNDICVTYITDMSKLFYDIHQFNGDISDWNVSNVTNMSLMFTECNFSGDISKWNVSNVKDMSFMFSRSKFNGDISNWDVSNVKDMEAMFANANLFDQDVSKWNVSNVCNMKYMFFGVKNFNQDISKWDVSNVLSMESMFRGALFFDQDLSGWNVVKVNNSEHFANICLSRDNGKMPKFNKAKKPKNDLYK